MIYIYIYTCDFIQRVYAMEYVMLGVRYNSNESKSCTPIPNYEVHFNYVIAKTLILFQLLGTFQYAMLRL